MNPAEPLPDNSDYYFDLLAQEAFYRTHLRYKYAITILLSMFTESIQITHRQFEKNNILAQEVTFFHTQRQHYPLQCQLGHNYSQKHYTLCRYEYDKLKSKNYLFSFIFFTPKIVCIIGLPWCVVWSKRLRQSIMLPLNLHIAIYLLVACKVYPSPFTTTNVQENNNLFQKTKQRILYFMYVWITVLIRMFTPNQIIMIFVAIWCT